MKLLKYNYRLKNFPNYDDWETDDIYFQKLNLVVGKNATGKSRVVNAPTAFAEMITQYSAIYWGNWNFTFTKENGQILSYIVNKDNDERITETVLIDQHTVLERDHQTARLFSFQKKEFETITPPDNKLILHIRRDKIEYPYLEDIVTWAEQTHFFKFGQIHSASFSGSDSKKERVVTVENIPAIIGTLDKSSKKGILEDFNKLGYGVEEFYTGSFSKLYIKENNLKFKLEQNRLSQGMFRAFALIVFIHYLMAKPGFKTIVIDDLGEGLDYDRVTKLGNLMFSKFEESDVQLIASSNDSFLMDVVNTRYWNILVRKDNRVKVYNYHNSKDKFDSFRYSGLSNFDLFSSDYLE